MGGTGRHLQADRVANEFLLEATSPYMSQFTPPLGRLPSDIGFLASLPAPPLPGQGTPFAGALLLSKDVSRRRKDFQGGYSREYRPSEQGSKTRRLTKMDRKTGDRKTEILRLNLQAVYPTGCLPDRAIYPTGDLSDRLFIQQPG